MHRKIQRSDQRGIVSFMVTLIMMLVISLIVIGFTQVAVRSRREALDKQLSSQAFYAAESGVNAAVETIKAAQLAGQPIIEKEDCNDAHYDSFPLDGTNVAVTCIMVNDHPDSIIIGASQNKSSVVLIDPTNAAGNSAGTLNGLSFTWSVEQGQSTATTGCSAVSVFQREENDCSYALLRVDLFQFNNTNVTGSNNLGAATATVYLQPRSNGSGLATLDDASAKGLVVAGRCTAGTGTCTADLALGGQYQGKKYYARLSTLYHDTPQVVIDGTQTSSKDAFFKGAQAVIDATGRAQDVLRRVQVRYPLSYSDDTPPWAAAGRVCKRLTVASASADVRQDGLCTP